jgi:hypothetical protein
MYRFFTLQLPQYAPDDMGGSADTGAGTGTSGTTDTGTGTAGVGTDTGDASPSFTNITPDTLIRVPGSDKPVKFSDYQKGYIPRADTENLVRQIVTAATAGRQVRQPPQQSQLPQRPDPLAELESRALIDGKTAAQLARDFRSGLSTRDKVIQKLQQQVQQLSGHVTGGRTEQLNRDFDSELDQVIGQLPIPKTDAPIDGANALREFAQGVFWKYDFEKPGTRKEFAPTVKKEFDQMRAFFRNLEKAELNAAHTRQRNQRFVRPSAGTGPNGKPAALESNRQISKRFFHGTEPQT